MLSPSSLPVCNNPQLTAFRVRGAFVCHGPSQAPAADTTGSTPGSHPEFMTQPVNHHQNNNQSSTSLSEVTLTLHAVGYCQSGEDIKN